MADGVHDEHDEHKPPEAEALSQFKKLYQSVPESAKQAFAEEVAAEAKKLAQSVGAESLVMKSASESSTAIVIISGAVADAEGTSGEMLKRGKHMMCRRIILLVRRKP